MIKNNILFYLMFNIICFVNAQSNETVTGKFVKRNNYFILNLPYEIENGVGTVFDEDTPYAIHIIEMRADGERLHFIEDIGVGESRTYFRTHEITEGRREYYISMFWKIQYSGEVLRWNDGRGIIFVAIAPNMFAPTTNTYEISRGMKTLEIRYRIIFPHFSLTVDELYDQITMRRRFSKERRMVVDISNIFGVQ